MKKFLTTLFLTLTFLAMVTGVHAGEKIKIGAASPTGEYTNTIVPAINKALNEHGYSAEAVISAGSQDNIDNIMAGEYLVALTQLDVAALNMRAEVDLNETLVLLGNRIAPEALFCVAHKEGNVKSYDDLTDLSNLENPIKISVGKQKSGTARTFQYLMTLDPNLKKENFKFFHGNTLAELNRLNSGRRDVVCFVINPNLDNELLKHIMNNKQLVFVNIDNPEFAKAKIGIFRIYNILDVPVSKKGFFKKAETVKTLVTWVYLIGNDKQIDDKLKRVLNKVANKPDLLPSDSVVGKAKTMICQHLPRLCKE